MKQPFFTISLSCCNVAPYLDECFDSILSQPFADWECVVWVEESDDGTPAVVRKRTAGDSRFRVFTGPKTGSCSVSRNKGIELARGEYILFADGDDCLAPGALRRLRERIDGHPGADLYIGAVRKFRHGTGETMAVVDNYPPDLVRGLTGGEATFLQSAFWPNPMLQLIVFRSAFLRSLGYKCIEGLRAQDKEFSPRALYRARRVILLHEVHYLYRCRENSIQTAGGGRIDYLYDDRAVIYRSLLAFYGGVSREDGFDPRVAAYWAHAWISRKLAFDWFDPSALATVPRQRRADTLRSLFADGFSAFDRLRRAGGAKTRLLGGWIKLFVLHPRLRGCVELFFRAYTVLNRLKRRLTTAP